VPRQTGYEWVARVRDGGVEALETRSSAPHLCPHATPQEVVDAIVAARRLHPTWGPRKLRPWLLDRQPTLVLPVASTMGEILKRLGLVPERRRRRRTPRYTEPFASAVAPNDVWTADFKGQFRLGDGSLCYPLTIADAFSRFLLRCDAYAAPDAAAKRSFELAFREYGLPSVIHTDNGTPFASTAPGGLSKLSAWWIRLGIVPERSAPGHPWENGRHERMHRTLKAECTRPARRTSPLQQRAFNLFREEFNHDRPHESLAQKPPATAYNTSPRPYPRSLPELEYPDAHELRRIDASGHFRWKSRKVFVSGVIVGEVVGLKRSSEHAWDVFFGPVLLGYISDLCPELGLIRYRK
jgi:transposase InsO family protein